MALSGSYLEDTRLDDVLIAHVALCRFSGIGPLFHFDLLICWKLEDKVHGQLTNVVHLQHDFLRSRVQRRRGEIKVEIEVKGLSLLFCLSNSCKRIQLSLLRRAVAVPRKHQGESVLISSTRSLDCRKGERTVVC